MTRSTEPEPFGPGSIFWDDFGQHLTIAFGGGAFVLQAMHPVISTVVDIHSDFREDPGGRAVRSTDSILKWIYGGPAAVEEGRRLLELHAPMHGTTAAGQPYRALDPEAYAWVHATAFVSAVTTHRYAVGGEMPRHRQEAFYEEFLQLGAILRIKPSLMPQTIDDYWDYYETMVHERLERTQTARDVLRLVETQADLPLIPRALLPLVLPQRLALGQLLKTIIVAGMTESARKKLGVTFTPAHDAMLRTVMSVVRPVHARLPEQVRYLPLAYHARRHAAELAKLDRRMRDAPPAKPHLVAA